MSASGFRREGQEDARNAVKDMAARITELEEALRPFTELLCTCDEAYVMRPTLVDPQCTLHELDWAIEPAIKLLYAPPSQEQDGGK